MGIFDSLLNSKCNVLGEAFKVLGIRYNYDSASTIKKIMTDKQFDWLFAIDDCQEWCDGYYLASVFSYYGNFKQGVVGDDYALSFLGYLYKYWMLTKDTSRQEIYKILPYERFMATFNFYHTQGWNYIIDDAIRVYQSGNYII